MKKDLIKRCWLRAGCDAGRLHRLMQAAHSFKVLDKLVTGGSTLWSNNSRSACLMDGHPNSMRALVGC